MVGLTSRANVRAFALPRKNTLYVHTAPTSEKYNIHQLEAFKTPLGIAGVAGKKIRLYINDLAINVPYFFHFWGQNQFFVG